MVHIPGDFCDKSVNGKEFLHWGFEPDGVTQRSVLGPLLFLTCVSDMDKGLKNPAPCLLTKSNCLGQQKMGPIRGIWIEFTSDR